VGVSYGIGKPEMKYGYYSISKRHVLQ